MKAPIIYSILQKRRKNKASIGIRRIPLLRPALKCGMLYLLYCRRFKPAATGVFAPYHHNEEEIMGESVYKIIELVGTSTESWEQAVANAVAVAAKSLRDLRIAEVVQMDVNLEDGKIVSYRAKIKVSFKYEHE
jgi:flavin-binding protein dodecin